MSLKAAKDIALIKTVLKAVKERGFIFIGSRDSLAPAVLDLARKMNIKSSYTGGCIDSSLDKNDIINKIDKLVKRAKKKGRIIIIAHSYKETIEALKEEMPKLKKEVSFVTIEEYFGLE